MASHNASSLTDQLAPPLDRALTESLIKEFINSERRYVLGDWEPATLDGGQFVEVAARVVYHIDSGNLNRRKRVNDCLKYVEDESNSNNHLFPERRAALHLCKVLRTIYKFRSQRGAIHIDPEYSANELDATLIMGNVRWVMSDLLRIFWTGSTADVAQAIREIVHFEVPAILNIDGQQLVLHTDCSVEEEVLLLLHNAGEKGLDRTELGKAIPRSASSITNAINRLLSPAKRESLKRQDGKYVLTPNGTKRVFLELAGKLTLT